ncbi:hypothetical protein EXIGLDRAFT_703303 [Exidia glandulosa HHB12029]|uniref:Uncharacterized protein n=1 Tax=Exidia glandulosa HHB12029 TaxID=1314781 RepID=A0A165C4C1_EXIGL|nr:hypothetical protein EXIGLDRAFT_703303 [Exidia glandulosa HHB12029]
MRATADHKPSASGATCVTSRHWSRENILKILEGPCGSTFTNEARARRGSAWPTGAETTTRRCTDPVKKLDGLSTIHVQLSNTRNRGMDHSQRLGLAHNSLIFISARDPDAVHLKVLCGTHGEVWSDDLYDFCEMLVLNKTEAGGYYCEVLAKYLRNYSTRKPLISVDEYRIVKKESASFLLKLNAKMVGGGERMEECGSTKVLAMLTGDQTVAYLSMKQ